MRRRPSNNAAYAMLWPGVCYMPVLYRIIWSDWAGFWLYLACPTLCFRVIRVSLKIRLLPSGTFSQAELGEFFRFITMAWPSQVLSAEIHYHTFITLNASQGVDFFRDSVMWHRPVGKIAFGCSSIMLLLRTEWSLLLFSLQQRLRMLFSGPDNPKNCSFPWGSQPPSVWNFYTCE